MSLSKIPITVANLLEKIQRQFLWGDKEDKRKLYLLGWNSITKSKKLGGLGTIKLVSMNAALLYKWWWRFGTEKQSLWYKVVTVKYQRSSDKCLATINSNFRKGV